MKGDAMEQIAEVRLTGGRFVLFVGGLAVAVQGDVCRDAELPSRTVEGAFGLVHHQWEVEALRDAATQINRVAEDVVADRLRIAQQRQAEIIAGARLFAEKMSKSDVCGYAEQARWQSVLMLLGAR